MALPYKLVEKGVPGKPDQPKKLYAVAKIRGEVKLKELAARIAEISTVSAIDTKAVLEALIQVVPKVLVDGNIVRLGNFGTFYPALKSSGVDKKEKFNVKNIEKIKIQFRPGSDIKETLSLVKYEKAE